MKLKHSHIIAIMLIKKNEVWHLVEVPEKNLVPGAWQFALQRKRKGEIIRHRARYVNRGLKKQGVDYDRT